MTSTFVSSTIPFVPMVPPLTTLNTFAMPSYSNNPTTQALVDNLVNNNPITTAQSTNVPPKPAPHPIQMAAESPSHHPSQVDNLSAGVASQLLIANEGGVYNADNSLDPAAAATIQNTMDTSKLMRNFLNIPKKLSSYHRFC